MKTLYAFIFLLLAGNAYGQSNLPACQGNDASKWSYCFGTYTGTQGSWKGDKYVGEFGALGVFHGKGTYFHLADNQFRGDKYVGEFRDMKFTGQATYTHAKGDKYVGEYKDNYRNGQGTFTYSNGEKYVGEFKDDKFNGQGTYTYPTGYKYVGEFKDNYRNGQGTFTYPNGEKYVGEFNDDKSNGLGIFYFANGSIKESGIFKDNVLVTSQYIDPNSFTRIARNNTALNVSDSQRLPACQGSDASKWSYCFGTYTETQGSWKGDKYVGEFGTLGIFHGQGTYFHLAENQWKGDKYVGQYKDGRRDGQGTYFHLAENKSKGDKYVGEYKDSKRNGQGTYFYLAENCPTSASVRQIGVLD